jgi:choline-glycine betaine transporter
LLGLYILIYLGIELIIFGSVVVTLKTSKFEEKQGRVLKLIGGMIMLALAITLLIDPGIMNNIGNTLLVFGSAFGAAFLILVLHRHILPRYGVTIGTETLSGTPRKGRSRR